MTFDGLELKDGWQQFSSVRLDFHPRLTVLTGANGAGKTTLLRFLARHFGHEYTSLLTPGTERDSTGLLYKARRLLRRLVSGGQPEGAVEIGTIRYSSGKVSLLRAPVSAETAPYQLTIDDAQPVKGFFLASHRPEFRYERVVQLSLEPRTWEDEAFRAVHDAIVAASTGGRSNSVSFKMKEVLVALWIFGSGAIQPDLRASELWEGFGATLKVTLPPDLGFERLEIRDRTEIVLITRTDDFLLDAVSGGIASIFELAWLIYMYDQQQKEPFVVVIDEPENHLHPAMQRTLLPSLVEAFPRAQFIVASHSPFIVGSVRESHVYALRFSPDEKVHATLLDFTETAGRAEELLRDVLGVGVTIPVWAERELEDIMSDLVKEDLTPESARQLRNRLADSGLSGLLPQVLVELAKVSEQ